MIGLSRSIRFGPTIIALAAASAAAQDRPAAPDTTAARATLRAARANADSGALALAESLYFGVARNTGLPPAMRGSAYFGSAFAAHRQLVAVEDDGRSRERIRRLEQVYDSARRLNRALYVPVTTNMALLNRSFDIHGAAVSHFVSAADASAGEQRTQLYTEAAVQADAAGNWEAAARLYETALTGGGSSETTVRAYLRSIAERAPAAQVLEAVARWTNDPRTADAAFDALVVLLTRTTEPVEPAQARRALGTIAKSLIGARVGPGGFQATVEEPLQTVAVARRDLAQGVEALIDAYRQRSDSDAYREPAAAAWWAEATTERAAWSSTLSRIGDWYNQREKSALARSFFEAAIGQGGQHVMERWADRSALVPLALIYAREDNRSAGRLQSNVRDFEQQMFVGKGAAYATNDVETIRLFHTVLGTYYAQKGQWTGPDARNAEFQLSRMRLATQRLNEEGRRLADSPDLLAALAAHYDSSGRQALATQVRGDVRRFYTTRGKAGAADSLFRVHQDRNLTRPPEASVRPPETSRSTPPLSTFVVQTQAPVGAAPRDEGAIPIEAVLLPLAAALGLALVVERILEWVKNIVDMLPTASVGRASATPVADEAEGQALREQFQNDDNERRREEQLERLAEQLDFKERQLGLAVGDARAPIAAEIAALKQQLALPTTELQETHPLETIVVVPATDPDDGTTLRAFVLQSMAAIIGIVAARVADVRIFDALTPNIVIPQGIDYLLTGLFIGGGSAPAHTIVRFLTDRKIAVPQQAERAEANKEAEPVAAAQARAEEETTPAPMVARAFASAPDRPDLWLDIPYAGGVDRDKLESIHRRGADPNLVVFHHTAMPLSSSFADVVRVIKSRKDSNGKPWVTGYNCVVLADGSIHPFCRWDRYGNHAQGYNRLSLGITLNGNFETDPRVPYSNPDGRYGASRPTEVQLDAAARVVALWTHLYPAISLDFSKPAQGIIPHKRVSPKTCPGNNFPYAQFEKLVRHYSAAFSRSSCSERIDAFKLRPFLYADPTRIPPSPTPVAVPAGVAAAVR